MPFDESKIAPELRRGSVAKEGTSSEPLEPSHKNSVRFNTTNLESVDISVDSDSDDSLSALDPRRLRALVESEEELSSENEREKQKEKENCTDNIFATGSQQVPASTSPATGSTSPPSNTTPPTTTPVDPTVIEQPEVLNTTPIVPDNAAGGQPLPNINSPADIYEHFSRRVDNRDTFTTGTPPSSNFTGSRDKTDRTPDDSSDNSECESALPATNIESCKTCDTTGTMQAEELTKLQDQIIALQQELKSQQEKARVFRTKTISAFEQTPIPDVSSPHRPTAFHGFDSEDINRWLDKVENYLTLRRIDTSTPTALAELVLNLAGPAEDFYYSLPGDCKDTFTKLRDALKERFANENQSWIIWQAITTRQQGPVEPLDTYLTDLTGKFRRINISDADKMRYFVQGLRADLRETVLLKQPKTFREAEEMARLASAVKTTMSNSNETVTIQLNNLTKTLNTLVANSNSPVSTNQQQSLQTQVETLTQKVNSLMPTVTKSDKVAAYSEPQVDFQSKIEDLTKLVKRMEGNFQDQIASLDKRMDARITGLAQRQRETRNTRERSRDGHPYCYVCGLPGHYQNSCPRRNNRERDRTPVPRYALPAPDNYTQYSSGPQARQRALPPPPHQSRIAAFQDSTPTSSDHPELPIYDSPNYDSVDWDYYYDDAILEATTNNYFNSHHEQSSQDFNDDDFYGEWDYCYDYESESETYDYADDWDQVYDEPNIQQPILSALIEEDLGNTATAHLPYLETDDLLPLTDDEYPSEDKTEKGDEFDLPAPVPYPLLPTITMHNDSAVSRILGCLTSTDQTTKSVMTYPPAPVDILPPPYPGDVGIDPTQYFGTNYPKPELAGYNKVALRMTQPTQTKEVKQKSTATAYSTLNADNHVTGDPSRSRYEDLPTESPTAMHSGEKTVSAQNVREMVTTQVSKKVKPLTNQETDRTTKLEQNYHVAPKAIPSDQSSFPCPEIRQSNPDTGQPGSNHSLRAQIVSTEPKTKRATHSQLHNDYQHKLKDQLTKVIKDLEGNLLNKITILERRMEGNLRHSKVQPWKRTCFYCGMVGHIQINCPHRSCQQGSYNYKVRHKPERIPHQAPTFQPAYTARDKPRCQDSGEEPYDVNDNSTKVGVILNQPKEVLKLSGLNSVAANSFKQTSFQIPNVPPDCTNVLNSQEQEKPKYQQNTLISLRQTPGERNRNQQVATSCTEKYPPQALQSSMTPTIRTNAVQLQKTGKSAALQLKIPCMFEKFISWFMLLVLFHLCFASQAHNLPQVQPTTQKLHNMHDYRQSAEKELFPSPKNDGRLTTETHTHNWHQPVSSTKFKYNFPLLNDDPLDDLIPNDLISK